MSKTIGTVVERARCAAAAFAVAIAIASAGPAIAADAAGPLSLAVADAACPPILRHTFNSLQTGAPQPLCQYAGKVVLIVDTASQGLFTLWTRTRCTAENA